ncbi:MAG TPA: hypothetical protein VMU04_06845 [Candidatus Acidoferrum sp.]|nr:hypothetical protein [Candidatus Acidoferrum sp.]
MNRYYQRVPTQFGPEVRFELAAGTPAPFRARQDAELERLKNELLRERRDEAWDSRLRVALRRAANDAAALAWVTPYPLLVFPVLFEEKARAALNQSRRQTNVRARSRVLLSA